MRKNHKIALACCAMALLFAPIIRGQKAQNNDSAIVRNLDIFNNVYKELNSFYVDTVNSEKCIETALGAMLNEIDPYTEYMPAKEQESFKTITSGEYAGIGSYIMTRKGFTYFSEPYEGSPADKAGIKPGDKIIMIDNDSVAGWASDKVSEHLKGQPNTNVRVVVERPYEKDNLTFNITRKKIQMHSVPYYGVERGNIGYISLTSFTDKSPQEIKDALLSFKKNPNVKSIVLDLRGNGGGLLESAIEIINYFVPKNTLILETKGRYKQNYKSYKTTKDPIDTKTPLVVLIDGGSASASEIVAGSLQDLDRAVIMGTRSFGKGLVQTTRPITNGGIFKVTVAKYYIPSGRLIQAIDYSHRNPDGSVARIPDSLTTVFHTANGREVRDGGGITPDVKVTYPETSRLVFNIVRDFWAFDYATKYAHEHKTIPAASDFVITDSIFNDFKKFIRPDEFKYDKVCEDALSKLKEMAKIEGYMNDSTKACFDQMEKLLKHDLNHDLDNNRKMVSQILANEIIKRYYYQKGQSIETIKDDECMDKAQEILSKPGEYAKILSNNKQNDKKLTAQNKQKSSKKKQK